MLNEHLYLVYIVTNKYEYLALSVSFRPKQKKVHFFGHTHNYF